MVNQCVSYSSVRRRPALGRPRRASVLVLAACAIFQSSVWAGPAASSETASSKTPGVITLEEAYDRALATDQSIRVAYYELRKANLQPWSALTALGPRVSASGGYSRSGGRTSASDGILAFNRSAESRSAGISLDQPLIELGVFPAYQLGVLTAKASRLELLYTIRQILFSVASSYYAVLKDQSLVRVDQESVKLSRDQLDLAQKMFNAGASARSDVLQATATLENAKRTLLQDENTLAVDRNTLANALNLESDNFAVSEPPGASENVNEFEYYLSKAYSLREDYQISKIAVDQNVQARNEIIAQYAPSVGASVGNDWNSPTGSANSRSWNAGISVSVPILNGGQREIDLRSAGHNIEESKLQLEQSKKSVQADVKNAWLQVQSLRESIKASQAEVDANFQNYKDTQTQYEVGSATSVDVQVALRLLNSSRANLTTEIYDYQVALRDLQRAAGLFQSERIMKTKLK